MPLAENGYFKPTAHEHPEFWCLLCTANFSVGGFHLERTGAPMQGPVLLGALRRVRQSQPAERLFDNPACRRNAPPHWPCRLDRPQNLPGDVPKRIERWMYIMRAGVRTS